MANLEALSEERLAVLLEEERTAVRMSSDPMQALLAILTDDTGISPKRLRVINFLLSFEEAELTAAIKRRFTGNEPLIDYVFGDFMKKSYIPKSLIAATIPNVMKELLGQKPWVVDLLVEALVSKMKLDGAILDEETKCNLFTYMECLGGEQACVGLRKVCSHDRDMKKIMMKSKIMREV